MKKNEQEYPKFDTEMQPLSFMDAKKEAETQAEIENSTTASWDDIGKLANQRTAEAEQRKIDEILAPFKTEPLSNQKYILTALKNKKELEVTVPDCVQIIGENAFAGSDVINITLAEGLIKIEKGAFQNCTSLEKINFPSTLRIIGDSAFAGCSALDIEAPEKVRVGKDAFKDTIPDIRAKEKATKERHKQEEAERQRRAAEEAARREAKAKAAEERRKQEEARLKAEAIAAAERRKQEEAERKKREEIDRKRKEAEAKAAEEWRKQEEIAKKKAFDNVSTIANISVWDTITFGNYPQNDPKKKEPIEWIVLKKEYGCALLLSKYVLFAHEYIDLYDYIHFDKWGAFYVRYGYGRLDGEWRSHLWSLSTLRQHLNDQFLSEAFSSAEQELICAEKLSTSHLLLNSAKGNAEETEDKVFVLEANDIKLLFGFFQKKMLKAKPTSYAIRSRVSVKHGHSPWWLRNVYEIGTHSSLCVNCITEDGKVMGYDSEAPKNDVSTFGVRPAILVKYE